MHHTTPQRVHNITHHIHTGNTFFFTTHYQLSPNNHVNYFFFQKFLNNIHSVPIFKKRTKTTNKQNKKRENKKRKQQREKSDYVSKKREKKNNIKITIKKTIKIKKKRISQ